MKISIEDFFIKYAQIRRKLRIWSHLLKKSLMKIFIFCAVTVVSMEGRVLPGSYLKENKESKTWQQLVLNRQRKL